MGRTWLRWSPTQGQVCSGTMQWRSSFLVSFKKKKPSSYDWWLWRSLAASSPQSTGRKWKAAGCFHVSVHAHTQPPAKNSYSSRTIWKPLRSLPTCVCIGGRRGLMRAVSGAPPGASYWLPVQLSQHGCRRRLQSSGDGGAGRKTVRSLREYSRRWILCFLAVTPTGFINSLVKRGKARCGSSAFLVKEHQWMFYVMGICILTAGRSWSLFSAGGPGRGRPHIMSARLFFFFFFLLFAFFFNSSHIRRIMPPFNISQVR